MTQRRLEEGERLRKELMEYVKFIVAILPDNWKGYATQGLDGQEFPLSPELQQQLREACGRQPGDGPKGHVHPPHPAGAPAEPLPPLRAPRRSSPGASHAAHQKSPYGVPPQQPPARAKTAR
ncbi:unnamed protein product [Prorocentrum cordatum]|uniref:Uncharacterized protein n=1 Tax=Prorocentrum cordatum TaxID=2364126 RepID=A0ABN9T9V1_9DINO|nr:unnamed protein product [Polarella glacialis]